MNVNSEQEMLTLGHRFASIIRAGDATGVATTGDAAWVIRAGDATGVAPTGDAAWGTPAESSGASDVGEDAAAGPVGTTATGLIGAIAIELIGDVGVGKTTFTRGLAKGLGVKEPITSPSFTISKAYALPSGGRFIHYDFYRLSDPGLMADDLAENLRDPRNIIVIEWGESVSGLLPERHIKLELAYTDDGRKLIL